MLMLEAPTPPAIAQKGKQAQNRIPVIMGSDSSFSPPGSTTSQVNGMIMPQSGEAGGTRPANMYVATRHRRTSQLLAQQLVRSC